MAPPERFGLLSAYVIATLVAPARELFCLSSSSLMKVELLLLLSLEWGGALLVDSQRRRLITLLRVQFVAFSCCCGSRQRANGTRAWSVQ